MSEQDQRIDLTLIPKNESELKRVEYEGWGLTKGEVVYKRVDNKIIFSAIKSSDVATSSVNAAEEIVVAICAAEGINWSAPSFYKDYEFYDLSTPVGYPGRKDVIYPLPDEEVQIDKLNIRPDRDYLFVESWTPVHLRRD